MTPPVTCLIEAASITKVAPRRYRARLIEGDRQGTSAYYPARVLRRDGPSVFHAGLPMYIDHPTLTERSDRPERSVRDLAGKLTGDAAYDRDGLYAEVEIYPHYAALVEAMADDIGLSIRASGTREASKDPAIQGPIALSLIGAQSVDLVTAAGCGGKLVSLLESARPSWFAESNGISARDIACSLADAVRETYATDDTYTWVSDWSDEWVIYQQSGNTDSFQQNYTLAPDGTAALTGEPVVVNRRTTYVPETGTTEAIESATPDLKGGVMTTPELSTAAPPTGSRPTTGVPLASLAEAQARVTETERLLAEARANLETRSNDRLARADAERQLSEALFTTARLRACESARSATAVALAESGLPACVHGRVHAAVTGLEGAALPMTEARDVDNTRLTTAINAAVNDWRALVGQILTESGVNGTVAIGSSGAGSELTEAQIQDRSKAIYLGMGMTEAQAAIAAGGR